VLDLFATRHMDDHQTETSKYTAYRTRYVPELDRGLLVAAVEFSHPGMWIVEHYALPKEGGVHGACIRTSYNTISTPRDILPTPDDELTSAVTLAGAAFNQYVFKKDRELWRAVSPLSDTLAAPLAPKELAILHLQGEFTDGLKQIRNSTECEALSTFLSDVLRLPQFKVDRTPEV
jgi:hypothetical protein